MTDLTKPASTVEPLLKRVVLSSGGVGQFEYEADIDGEAVITMPVPLDQVDDVLKSLRVLDPAGTPVSVRLPGRQPLAETFRVLPFTRTALTSAASMLAALVGAEVRLPATGAHGKILSVSKFTLAHDTGTQERHHLSILTENGLDTAVLEDTAQVEIRSSALRRQIDNALTAIAANQAQDSRTLDITLGDGGARTVLLSTVIPVPIWKTSYRAVLPPLSERDADASSYLEAWAVVENLSGQPWQDVDVTLTSGQPILYHQTLYDPLFADRPEAPVEVSSRIMPRVDKGAIRTGSGVLNLFGGVGSLQNTTPGSQAGTDASKPETVEGFDSFNSLNLVGYGPSESSSPIIMGLGKDTIMGLGADTNLNITRDISKLLLKKPDVDTSMGDTQVLFHLSSKVSATPGQSLLLPLLSQAMEIRRIALYQPITNPTRPLATLELTNNTKTALPPGLITLYEQSRAELSYIGDARLSSVQPGETRLASFAIDLPVKVDAEETDNLVTVDVRAAQGTLQIVRRHRRTITYRVATPADSGRHFIVEVPREAGWHIIEPATEEANLSPTDWRIGYDLPADKTTVFQVVLERNADRTIILGDCTTTQLLTHSSGDGISKKGRGILKHAGELRAALDKLNTSLKSNTKRQETIVTDQDRVRKNLGAVPKNSDLQRKYLQQLQTQETLLSTLRTQHEELRQQADDAAGALQDYIASLNF